MRRQRMTWVISVERKVLLTSTELEFRICNAYVRGRLCTAYHLRICDSPRDVRMRADVLERAANDADRVICLHRGHIRYILRLRQ